MTNPRSDHYLIDWMDEAAQAGQQVTLEAESALSLVEYVRELERLNSRRLKKLELLAKIHDLKEALENDG